MVDRCIKQAPTWKFWEINLRSSRFVRQFGSWRSPKKELLDLEEFGRKEWQPRINGVYSFVTVCFFYSIFPKTSFWNGHFQWICNWNFILVYLKYLQNVFPLRNDQNNFPGRQKKRIIRSKESEFNKEKRDNRDLINNWIQPL